MPKYIIEREIPGAGEWNREQQCEVAGKSCAVLAELGPAIQWIQSYVTPNKLFCVYLAPDEEMIREHARRGGFPVNAIHQVQTILDPSFAEQTVSR